MASSRFVLAVAATIIAVSACGGSDGVTTSDASNTTQSPTAQSSEDTSNEATADEIPGETGAETNTDTAAPGELYPDVVDATASFDGSAWTVSATLSSPYDSPERYADAWRVLGPDGTVYGERILMHDHANEQPFTRSQSGIEIPDDVDEVTIEGRDQVSGYGGETFTLALTR